MVKKTVNLTSFIKPLHSIPEHRRSTEEVLAIIKPIESTLDTVENKVQIGKIEAHDVDSHIAQINFSVYQKARITQSTHTTIKQLSVTVDTSIPILPVYANVYHIENQSSTTKKENATEMSVI